MLILTGVLGSIESSAAETEVFVYAEPYEVRLEILVPANQLTPPGNTVIDSSIGEQLLARWADELRSVIEVKADEAPIALELRSIQFARQDDQGVEPDERDAIPIDDAFVAIVLSAGHDQIPQFLEFAWKFSPLDEKGRTIAVQFEAMIAAETIEFYQKEFTLTSDSPVCSWKPPVVQKRHEETPVANQKSAARWFHFSAVQIGGLALISLVIFLVCKRVKIAAIVFVGGLFAIILTRLAGNSSGSGGSDKAAEEPVDFERQTQLLLREIYTAFDFRDESRIYDTLNSRIDGDLLETIYLDIRRGLEIAESGGPRVRIGKVQLADCKIETTGAGFTANARWIASGSVSHYGHRHPRRNSYDGVMKIEKHGENWKLIEMEILDEQRN